VVVQEEADPAAALKSFETAMAIDPRHSDAEIHCGALYRRRASPGDLTIARSLLSSGLKHKPNSLVGWYNLGLIDRCPPPLFQSSTIRKLECRSCYINLLKYVLMCVCVYCMSVSLCVFLSFSVFLCV
jgi:hypothetical protein